MTDLTKIAGSQKHGSSPGVGELIATAAVVFLLIAVQGMFIAEHAITLNAAAESASLSSRLEVRRDKSNDRANHRTAIPSLPLSEIIHYAEQRWHPGSFVSLASALADRPTLVCGRNRSPN